MNEVSPQARPVREDGDLHTLLLKACPPSVRVRYADGTKGYHKQEGGLQSITILAYWLASAESENDHIARWSIYKWIKKDRVPPDRAREIVDLADGRVTLADFTRFVYGL